MRADRILVIQGGTIVEEGSHSDLIKKKGKYHSLWSKQVFFTPPESPEQSRSSESPVANVPDEAGVTATLPETSMPTELSTGGSNKVSLLKKSC